MFDFTVIEVLPLLQLANVKLPAPALLFVVFKVAIVLVCGLQGVHSLQDRRQYERKPVLLLH